MKIEIGDIFRKRTGSKWIYLYLGRESYGSPFAKMLRLCQVYDEPIGTINRETFSNITCKKYEKVTGKR